MMVRITKPFCLRMFVPYHHLSNLLPALLFSLVFLVLAWWLWQRELRVWAVLPLLTFLFLFTVTIVIKLQDINRTQCLHDVDVLLTELSRPDLWEVNDLTNKEELLFLASSGSMALSRARVFAEDRRGKIDTTLFRLASWVAKEGKLGPWRSSRNWDLQAFFLAHAGATLGHYQLATGDVTSFGDKFQDIGEHLGQRLRRGRYKHLISRPQEEFFRPADNAAALYALSLYEQAYDKKYLEANYGDWSAYLEEELYYSESRLPCAAFSTTNRCQLEPSATATGLYIAYRAAAIPGHGESAIPWQEWMHYFKKTSFSPFTVSVRHNMRNGQETRFCDLGAQPLGCNHYEHAVGLWAAAEYRGSYTYFRLFSTQVFRRWFYSTENYDSLGTVRKVQRLTRLALQTIGTAK